MTLQCVLEDRPQARTQVTDILATLVLLTRARDDEAVSIDDIYVVQVRGLFDDLRQILDHRGDVITLEHICLREDSGILGKAGETWLSDLEKVGTDADKPFLDTAAWLIVIFLKRNSVKDDGSKQKNYYMQESCGIATGFLINALHRAGLATLTHTPNPMTFLGDVLGRPANERAYMILVAGYPTDDAVIPIAATRKKPLKEIASFVV